MASQKIEDCTLDLQEKYRAFKAGMDAADLPFMLTCTSRTVWEQIALFAQGRKNLDMVNFLRRACGLSPISFTENLRKVTWTLASKHIIDLEDNKPGNDKSRAFDIAIMRDGIPVWNLKIDVNINEIPDYDEAGRIGEAVGLRWGGRFPSPDRPHFEVTL